MECFTPSSGGSSTLRAWVILSSSSFRDCVSSSLRFASLLRSLGRWGNGRERGEEGRGGGKMGWRKRKGRGGVEKEEMGWEEADRREEEGGEIEGG